MVESRDEADRDDALLAQIASTDRVTRLVAIHDLGETRNPAAVRPLVQCLQAKDELVQGAALKALAKIGDAGVASNVYEVATTSEARGVYSIAAETLLRLGDRRGATLLGALVRDRTCARSYRKWATKLLVEVRGTEALPDLAEAVQGARLLERRRLQRAIKTLRRVR